MTTLFPTVVIGLGTSGAAIIEGIQQRMYEMFKVNTLPIFRYIVIETDRTYAPSSTPSGQSIQILSLSSGGVGRYSNFQELLTQLKEQNVEPDWIDDAFAQRLVAQGEGAGGVRPVGRLILWANFPAVKTAIENAQQQILSDAAIRESRRLLDETIAGRRNYSIATTKAGTAKHAHAIVCGTSTGGTYSGSFVDLGYLCQHVLDIPDQDRQSLYALTLLPPKEMPGREPADFHRFKGNAHGVLLEGDYFGSMADTHRSYREMLPGMGQEVVTQVPPFAYSYLVSQEYGGGSSRISSPEALCSMASLKLFCDLMGLEGQRVARIIDHVSSGRRSTNTFGLSAIMHPQYQISEYAACTAGAELCQRWTNPKEYINYGGQEFAVPSALQLESKARTVWEGDPDGKQDGLLASALKQLTAQSSDLGMYRERLRKDVDRLLRGQAKQVLRSFLEPGDTYYGIIQNNLPAVTANVNERLDQIILDSLEQNQSVQYAIHYAEALKAAAQKVLGFWEALDIPETSRDWSDYVGGDVNERVHRIINNPATRVSNLLVGRELVQSVLLDVLDELKAHLLIPRIHSICEHLDEQIKQLGTYRRMLQLADEILTKRLASIREQVEDESLPIKLVYAHDGNDGQGFERDVAEILGQVARPHPSAADLADDAYTPTSGSQWLATTLRDWHDDDRRESETGDVRGTIPSERIKLAYQEKMIHAIDQYLEVDLASRVRSGDVHQYFGRGKECNLRYKPEDGRRRSLGEYLIGPVEATTNQVRTTITNSLSTTFQDSNVLALPGIDHMLLYYREEPVGDPLRTLENADELKRCFETPPNDPTMEPWVKEHWTSLRVAYDVPRRLQDEYEKEQTTRASTDLRHLIRLVADVCVTWKQHDGQGWMPAEPVEAIEGLPITVAPSASDGSPAIHWMVQRPHLPPRSFEVVDSSGSLVPDGLKDLQDDPETMFALVASARNAIGEIGRDGLLDLWTSGALSTLEQRIGARQTTQRYRDYFGSNDEPGLVDRLLNSESPVADSIHR